tara:strand:+ start:5390 stop:5989 length:600 start_codon:yes stop_codon:yes gene_type:complete
MKEFWDKRYANKEMAYGEDANLFFAQQLSKLKARKILLPAEGEGRNAIHSAKLGWQVSAFDISKEGKQKAEQLAQRTGVTIDYTVGGLEEISYQKESFDAIALIYAHFPAPAKSKYHKILASYLKKGGTLILEGFSKKQIETPESGGPKKAEMLFSVKEIKQDFDDFEIMELSEREIVLNEGLYHKGKGSVIRFVGKKK